MIMIFASQFTWMLPTLEDVAHFLTCYEKHYNYFVYFMRKQQFKLATKMVTPVCNYQYFTIR